MIIIKSNFDNTWKMGGNELLAPPSFNNLDSINTVKNDSVLKETTILAQRINRNDKKHDIRIPVNEEEKRFVRFLASDNGMSMTKFTTATVEKALFSYSEFPDYPYLDSENVVHAKVDNITYKKLASIAASRDCSVRKATYIVFKHILTSHQN